MQIDKHKPLALCILIKKSAGNGRFAKGEEGEYGKAYQNNINSNCLVMSMVQSAPRQNYQPKRQAWRL